jgi:hypothetical protein
MEIGEMKSYAWHNVSMKAIRRDQAYNDKKALIGTLIPTKFIDSSLSLNACNHLIRDVQIMFCTRLEQTSVG